MVLVGAKLVYISPSTCHIIALNKFARAEIISGLINKKYELNYKIYNTGFW